MSNEKVLMALRAAKTVSINDADVITPEMAQAFLDGNTHNRKVKSMNYQKLVSDMERGRWDFNGESIKFSADGTLLDGQHRLMACVESGKPFIAIIITGLQDKAQETVDTGSQRTLPDILRLRGYGQSAVLASYLRHRVRVCKLGLDRAFKAMQTEGISNSEAIEFLNSQGVHEEFREMSNYAGRSFRIPQAMAFGVFPELKKSSPDDFEFFVEKLISGENLGANDPIARLREVYIQHFTAKGSHKNGYTNTALAAMTIKAWNKYMQGEKCSVLRFSSGGAKPESFPEIFTA